ncbi:MAG TPA: nitroreductase family protein, partial [Candidatus Limnocylindria bacterium]
MRPIDFLRARPPSGRLAGDPVPEDALTAILDVANATGSSGGRHPWRFVVLRDRATIDRLAELAPEAKALRGAPVAIVIVMPGGQVALDAFDEGRAAERILLAARAQGLAARIGWVLADQRPAVRALLGIEGERLVRTTIAIGRPQEPA